MVDDIIIHTVSAEDIYKKLTSIEKVQNKILVQAQLTNGRVSVLENRSIGFWIQNHPFKFILLVFVFLLFLISDSRYFILSGVYKWIVGVL